VRITGLPQPATTVQTTRKRIAIESVNCIRLTSKNETDYVDASDVCGGSVHFCSEQKVGRLYVMALAGG
jgi:hypothetical protein